MAQTVQNARRSSNGSGATAAPTADAMAEAIAYEQAIADEATTIRGEQTALTPKLFMELWPLLRRPIPQGFIKTVGVVTGKPYESTGIKSVQVQVDRMNNVLTPMWWHDEPEYSEGGKLCKVTVSVAIEGADVRCTSYGGVDRGSTLGNIYKGSYTNAAKRAFAAVGPGHEVYLGATDLDPDVHEKAAAEQAKPDRPAAGAQTEEAGKPIGAKKAGELVDVAWALGLKDKLQLAASHVVGDDVGDCSNKTAATKALTDLTQVQATKVEHWLNKKADAQMAIDEAASSEKAS